MLIKYIKSVLWRVAKSLSYIEEARCLKVKQLDVVVQRGFVKLHTETELLSKCVLPNFCPLKLSLTPVNQTKVLVTNEGYCMIIGTNIFVIRSDMEKYRGGWEERVHFEGRLEGVDA